MKNFLLISILAMSSISALAQDGYTSLHYDISFALGNTSDFISQPSFRGVGFDYRKMVTGNVGVGISMAYHTFYERKDYDTYSFDDGVTSLSGVQFRYLNALPLHISSNYYFGEDGDQVRPYLGVGIGTLFSERRTEMGQWSSTTNSWQFSLLPEVGLLYQISSDAYLFTAAKFTTPFKNADFDSQPFLSLNIGMAWMLQ
ncbi:MAG: OmpW family outer membrane protein [Bacteroidota bacterium]